MRTSRRSGFMALFGLPFAAVGIGVFGWLLLPALQDWQHMKSWTPVEATLLSVELAASTSDNSTSYTVHARYRYDYAANTFESDRVAVMDGSDNIGSYWQDLASRLEADFADDRPVTVYVDPANPRNAVIDRELRPSQFALLGLFAMVFASAGIVMVITGLMPARGGGGVADRSATTGAGDREPWRANPAWASPVRVSNTKTGAFAAWLFAFIWCAVSGAGNFFIADEVASGNYAILFILLFDAVGIGLIVWAARLTWSARKFGAVALTMDPHPGAIGGDVAGHIDIPVAHDPARAYHVTLSCVHVYVTGSGKNQSTHRDARWQDEQSLLAEPLDANCVRLWFRFAPPAGLPASEPESHDYHAWNLRVDARLPGLDFARDYELPVFATGVHCAPVHAARVRPALAQDAGEIDRLTRFTQIPGGAAMHFPAGRHWLAGLVLLAVFGGAFGGFGVAALAHVDDFIGRVLFGGLFTFIGAICAASGAWMIGNGLRVEADDTALRIRRSLFGITVRAIDVPRADVAGIAVRQGSTTAVGTRVILYYDLLAKTVDGRLLDIGDGLRGATQARRAAEAFALYARMPYVGEVAK